MYADDRKEATAAAFAMAANVSPGLAKTLFVSFPQNLREIQPQLRGNDNVKVFIPTTNLESDFSEELINNLRTAINDHGFDTIVIDNLNRISALSTGRNAALTQLVNSLFALHVETDATILITAYNLSKSTRFRLAALTDTSFSAETASRDVELQSNHRPRQCESRDAGEASRRSWGTV
ncbi:MAG: AAA family ATPase, partial [Muribaculaceae bacterium]|nr:AAA family ATPase [Muribaculaceae bacterium]